MVGNSLYISVILFLIANLAFGQNTNQNPLSRQYNGKYIGGMKDYQPIFSESKRAVAFTVNDKEGLLSALKEAKSYSTIYIDDDAEIDLTDQGKVYVKTGIKLVSGRGKNGSSGALIYTRNRKAYPLFECGSSVAFIGLRIFGMDNDVYFGSGNSGNLQPYFTCYIWCRIA